jgi:hypothetical protein
MPAMQSRYRLAAGLAVIGLLGSGGPMAKAAESNKVVDLLLVLAVDVSESINGHEAWLQRTGYADALADPRVVAAIKGGRHGSIAITYLEWAGPREQHQVVGWTRVDSRNSADALRDALRTAPVNGGYWTSISGALDRATRLIAAAPYQAKRRVIDLSSDGRNNAGAPLAAARQRTLAQGITINGLPVMIMQRNFSFPPIPFLDQYFTECVIGGPGAFSITVETAKDLANAVRRKLIREIAITPETSAPILPAAIRSGSLCREDLDTTGSDKS